MAGTFGYELDLSELSDSEKAEVKEQIGYFDRHYGLIQNGRYFRLTGPEEDFTAWQVTAPETQEALVSLVLSHPRANASPIHFLLKGLDAEKYYRVVDYRVFGVRSVPFGIAGSDLTGQVYSGAALMYAGITLPQLMGDYPSVQLYLVQID